MFNFENLGSKAKLRSLIELNICKTQGMLSPHAFYALTLYLHLNLYLLRKVISLQVIHLRQPPCRLQLLVKAVKIFFEFVPKLFPHDKTAWPLPRQGVTQAFYSPKTNMKHLAYVCGLTCPCEDSSRRASDRSDFSWVTMQIFQVFSKLSKGMLKRFEGTALTSFGVLEGAIPRHTSIKDPVVQRYLTYLCVTIKRKKFVFSRSL